QCAHEENARGEDADRGMCAPYQVLVHGAGALVLASKQRDRVRDRQHAETGDQHGERRVEPSARDRSRHEAQDDRRREHGPIARACATAWMVPKRRSPSSPPAAGADAASDMTPSSVEDNLDTFARYPAAVK